MSDGLIFANGRAKALESNLVTADRMARILECDKLVDAVRILSEINYGGGLSIENPQDFDLLLRQEKEITAKFLLEVIPEGRGVECFFVQDDYHNIKALTKAKYANIADPSSMLIQGGIIGLAKVKEQLAQEKTDFNQYIIDALDVIKHAHETKELSPRLIDISIDKAMYQDINNRLSARGADLLIKLYFKYLIDATNIATLLRTASIGETMSFFENNFINGGDINLNSLQKTFGDPLPKLIELTRGTLYFELVSTIDGYDISQFDTAKDNFLLQIFAKHRNDMFSIAPVLGYYLAKINEIKVLRVALVCIKNSVSKLETKKRLRNLYV